MIRFSRYYHAASSYVYRHMSKCLRYWIAASLLHVAAFAAIQLQLTPSVPSPQPVGTTVTWTATATDSNHGLLNYRYIVAYDNVPGTVKDYSQANTFNWTPSVWEGNYVIQVKVRNNSTQETAQVSMPFTVISRVSGAKPVASATANPLVALFSAPACPSGSVMRVRFRGAGTQIADYTNWRSCRPGLSMNFYIAGMRANASYFLTPETATGGVVTDGTTIGFQTGTPTVTFPSMTTPIPASGEDSLGDHVLLMDGLFQNGGFPLATDLAGNVIWYYAAFDSPTQTGAILTRAVPGGTMLVIANGPNSANSVTNSQILREIDLAGNTVRETNATRIREQLVAMGGQSACAMGGAACLFGAFHHEAIRLPNGDTMAFGDVEQMFPAGTQGSTGPVDIIGDIIVELDQNFQVVWSWSAFDHDGGGTQLDINRPAVLGETCKQGGGGCPPLYLASVANDWLHSNSLQYRTTDHNLIMSLRHQDWVIKIDYQDGQGTGDILWRLGNEGDFSIISTDPWPWFSHQHDAGFEPNGVFDVFDDGNTRVADNPGLTENSRGQAYRINETTMVATQILNADLGVYSFALGSAQLLSNGNYHFLAGINTGPSGSEFSQSIEVLPNGSIGFIEQSTDTAYRSFRMPNLYSPPTT